MHVVAERPGLFNERRREHQIFEVKHEVKIKQNEMNNL